MNTLSIKNILSSAKNIGAGKSIAVKNKSVKQRSSSAPTRVLALGSLLAVLSACGNSWVQVTPEGVPVRLATASEVTNCTRVGVANVNALDNIAFVQRGAKPLQQELVNLARNEGGRVGGNRVVPESTIDNGRQTFGVFRC